MMWKIVFPVFSAVFSVGLGGLAGDGGISNIDISNEGMLNALNYAVVQHNQGSNDLYLSQVVKVIDAKAQVVAGMKYVITVRMAKTPCRKGSENEVCAIYQEPAMPYQCTFTVWSRPWINDIQLLKETC
uniref:Cystatin domain-containing protein n=1 Tax=Sander lucioperca TaxID=283035 RepID=A0A8C9YN94_SANLU